LQEKHTDWLTFVVQYRDGSFDRFAVDPFTLLSDNYVACDDARERQEEGSLKLGEIVLVYRDRRLVASESFASCIAWPCSAGVSEHP
jgi:hypothetical protein